MRQEKDAVRQEKLQVLYWLKTQMVDSVLSAAVMRRETSYHNTKMVVELSLGRAHKIIVPETSFGKAKNHECTNYRKTRKRIERPAQDSVATKKYTNG
jgi:hypothetical protein